MAIGFVNFQTALDQVNEGEAARKRAGVPAC
jgi:hypothetical protein